MRKVLNRILCSVFGHKPHKVTYYHCTRPYTQGGFHGGYYEPAYLMDECSRCEVTLW